MKVRKRLLGALALLSIAGVWCGYYMLLRALPSGWTPSSVVLIVAAVILLLVGIVASVILAMVGVALLANRRN